MISAREVQIRRMFTGAHLRPHRRRPLPLQAQPNSVRLAYLTALSAVIGRARELVDAQLVPKLPELVRSVNEKYFVDIKNATLQALRTGQRAEDIADLLQERFDITETRAALIARDQIGKLHAEVNRARQQEVGVDEYVWRGAMDERERPEHRAREGKTFSWSKPPPDGHPGEPVNCRCTAEPKLDELLANL